MAAVAIAGLAIDDIPAPGLAVVTAGLACWVMLDASIRLCPPVGGVRSMAAIACGASFLSAALVAAGVALIVATVAG